MKPQIKNELISLTSKCDCSYIDRIIKLFDNTLFLESDEIVLYEWLKKINEKIDNSI